jgi:Extensin-like protein C-terminus
VSGITTSGIGAATAQTPPLAAMPDLMRPSISIGGQRIVNPGGTPSDSGLGVAKIFGEPSRLGGPKAGKTAAVGAAQGTDTSSSAHMQFLRAVHASACKTFGTTLGPEANDAHRNHFHFDLAERKISNFCE